MSVTFDKEVAETWAEIIKNGETQYNYVMIGYEGASHLKVVAKGNGGHAEFCAKLDDDNVYYGAFRVHAADDSETETLRTKFVLVFWTGKNIKPVTRARVTVHKSEVLKVFKNHHIEFAISSLEDITQANVESKLLAATGSHKPKHFKF